MTIELTGISVAVDDALLIDTVDLSCSTGEIVGLLGPNGSGKSTALKTIYRVLRPCSGVVRLDGVDALRQLSRRDAARRIGALPQEHPGGFDFTVLEVVRTGRIPHKSMFSADGVADRRVVQEALDVVGMTDQAHRRFTGLSGGEKQRVLLARALAQEPEVLVLDEPTNHLDVATQLDLLDLVRSLGVTVLAAMHDLNLAATYCDRVYVLRDGAVVAGGETASVLTPDLIADVFGVRAHCGTHPHTGCLHLAFSPLDTGGSP